MTWRMPAEWEPHERTWMAWPSADYTLEPIADEAYSAWSNVANAIVYFEPVTMLVNAQDLELAKTYLDDRVELLVTELNDGWARDIGPTFVKNSDGDLAGVNWVFNG